MYRVIGKDTIQISRGDYGLIPLRITGAEDGETIVFSVSKEYDPEEPLIEKTAVIAESMAYIALTKADTRELDSGKYIWDVKILDFWEEGEPHTPITPRTFQVLGVSHSV